MEEPFGRGVSPLLPSLLYGRRGGGPGVTGERGGRIQRLLRLRLLHGFGSGVKGEAGIAGDSLNDSIIRNLTRRIVLD